MQVSDIAPLWQPSADRMAGSNIVAFMREAEKRWSVSLPDYEALWRWSVDRPENFWTLVWDFCGIVAETRGDRVIADGDAMPGARFFPDARLSFAQNLMRRRDDTPALIFKGEDRVKRQISWAQLYDEVSCMAQAMRAMGIVEGDRVAAYMPNMPETVIAMLGANSIGAIFSSASPDFGVQGVVDRFGQIEPKILIAADGCYYATKTIDVIDRVDVSSSPTSLESANGNIGDGKNYGMNMSASIRMRMINMPNLLLTTQFNVQDSNVTDPFLGFDRRFALNDRGRLTLGFRHDIPSLRMNYGLTWNNRFDGGRKRYDIDDIEQTAGDPNVQAFVEWVAFGDITFRFDARNITDNLQCRERHRYLGPITSGIIEEYEDQCGGAGRTLALRVNGTF